MIAIVPYQPAWVTEFEQLAVPLRAALAELALRIDHIGSTAVPGLAAKNIIDIQVTVAALDPSVETALQRCGYDRRTHITHDHLPPGVFDADQWQKWYFRVPARARLHHLHVRVAGRANQRYALLFRDYLRTHPEQAAAYGLIKQRLAHDLALNVEGYYAVKDPVCDLIWCAAEAWAIQTGWNEL